MKAALLIAVLLGGCSASNDLPADSSAQLDPIAFFSGHSEGHATLHKLVGHPVKVTVESVGRSDRRGGLVVDQIIRESDKAARQRRWVMVAAGPGHFTGSLTDARGPVDLRVVGPRAAIRYTMKNGMKVRQDLALQRDRRTLLNRLIVTKLGIRVARLDETIRKLD